MEEKRKQQLLEQVKRAYNHQIDKIDPNPKTDDVEEILHFISDALSFGTIIVSGRRNPSSYIGTLKQCKALKDKFEGQIGAVSNVWYWMGYASSDDITKVVANRRKNLVVSVPVEDIEDATLNLAEAASLDIVYGYDPSEHMSYIGSYWTCVLMRRALGGKVNRIFNHWHWIGYANLNQIVNVCNKYHTKSRRYRRRKIVFMY